MRIYRITPFQIEYNGINGFFFHLLHIDISRFEGDLLGLSFSKDYLEFDLCFIHFEVKSPL